MNTIGFDMPNPGSPKGTGMFEIEHDCSKTGQLSRSHFFNSMIFKY